MGQSRIPTPHAGGSQIASPLRAKTDSRTGASTRSRPRIRHERGRRDSGGARGPRPFQRSPKLGGVVTDVLDRIEATICNPEAGGVAFIAGLAAD